MNRLLLTALVAVAMLVTGVFAGSATAADTFHASFRGDVASAYFYSYDPSGCVMTNAYVGGVDGRVKTDGDPVARDSTAYVSLSRYDYCTGMPLVSAWGSAVIPADAFRVSRDLGTAQLDATIEAYNWVSAGTIPVDIDMSWTATSDVFRSHGHSVYQAPGFLVQSTYQGTSRQGTAAGSISDGSSEFAPDASAYADLNSFRNADVFISH